MSSASEEGEEKQILNRLFRSLGVLVHTAWKNGDPVSFVYNQTGTAIRVAGETAASGELIRDVLPNAPTLLSYAPGLYAHASRLDRHLPQILSHQLAAVPTACIFILAVELCERLAFYTFTGTQDTILLRTIIIFGVTYSIGGLLATTAAAPSLMSSALYLFALLVLVPMGTAGTSPLQRTSAMADVCKRIAVELRQCKREAILATLGASLAVLAIAFSVASALLQNEVTHGHVFIFSVVSFALASSGALLIILSCENPEWVSNDTLAGVSLSADDTRNFLKLVPVIITAQLAFGALYNCMQYSFQQQACQMDVRIPGSGDAQFAGSFFMIGDCLGIAIATPIAVGWFNPLLESRLGRYFSHEGKFLFGMFVGGLSVILAAYLELMRRAVPVSDRTAGGRGFDDIEPHLEFCLEHADVVVPHLNEIVEYLDDILFFARERVLWTRLEPLLPQLVVRLPALGPHLPNLRRHAKLVLPYLPLLAHHADRLAPFLPISQHADGALDALVHYLGWALQVPGLHRFLYLPGVGRALSYLAVRLPFSGAVREKSETWLFGANRP
eukprot:g8934.t1